MAVQVERTHGLLPKESYEKPPRVPFWQTKGIVNAMPEGKWELPESYMAVFNVIEEGAIEKGRETISKWIPFLDNVEEFNNSLLALRNKDSKDFSLRIGAVEDWGFFEKAFRFKLKREESDIATAVESVRKAFLYLLTDKQAEESGHERPEEISDTDAENARHLVKKFSHYNPFPPPIE